MNYLTINSINRNEIQSKYVDALVGDMDFITMQQMLKDYIHDEKNNYSHDDLRDEILSRSPNIRDEIVNSDYNSFAFIGE